MAEFLTFVVAGLTVGSAIALVAVGLVLTYRTSGILNFAHGGLAIVAVDAYTYLTINRGWSWQLSAFVSVVVVGAVMGLLLEPLGRILLRGSAAFRVVATVGLLVAIEAGSSLLAPHIPGSHPHFAEPPLPGETVKIGGVFVGKDQLIIMAVALVCSLGLGLFLKRARLGLAMRAVVTNPELVDLTGARALVVRRYAWIIAAVFAALSGVLLAIAPSFGSLSSIDLLIVPSFAAAAIAAFVSLPLAYAGGLLVGILSALFTRYAQVSWLVGLPAATPYLILIIVLLVTPRRRLEPAAATKPIAQRADPRLPGSVQGLLWAGLTVVVVLVPGWTGFGVGTYTTTLIYVILFLSLGLLLKTSGLVSLCQITFAAIGAGAFAHAATDWRMPWLPALLLAVVIAAAVGALVALAAIRLSGVFLALATLGFGYALQQLVYPTGLLFGNAGATLTAPRPSFATSDDAYYALVAVVVLLCVAVVYAIDHTRLGRLLRGITDSQVALQVQGTSVQVTKVLIFGASAGMAGLAGALLAGQNQFVTPSAYPVATSLTLVTVVFVLRVDHPWYAFAAAILFYLVPLKVDVAQPGTWSQLIFGIAAIVTVVVTIRSRRRATRTRGGLARGPTPSAALASAGVLSDTPTVAAVGTQEGLEVSGLTVRFGGIVALDHVDVHAPMGAITGLIGPNGAGKSTFFNACSGLVRPTAGRILLNGADLGGRRVAERARLGLGRTFQRPELFDSLTVREAVALGLEASQAGANPLHHVLGRSGATAPGSEAVAEAIELVGVEALADHVVAELSAAQRRLVELARCLSTRFALLLLDEPTAGLDVGESRQLVATLRRIVEVRGVGILLVEHDMSVVLEVCDRVAVLDFGQLLFEGTPEAVAASAVVRTAYLGDPRVAPTPVGPTVGDPPTPGVG